MLDPDTVYFLGDLFDGGREWSTGKSESPLKQWNKYGEKFWLQEYDRFGRIFLDEWNQKSAGKARFGEDRKLIASLPGNHDLGLGNGIRSSVRDRFHTYFGHGNRVDVVANHSFVSIDTVSLSAKGQPTPDSTSEDNGPDNIAIWGATDEFLSQVKDKKARALSRELRIRAGKAENTKEEHRVFEINDPALRSDVPPSNESSDLPTILLTHVPLYRDPGTPCGPLRERWPSTKGKEFDDFSEKDYPNALLISNGYQYQNVLHPSISHDLIDKIGTVEYVFSGDDHDYCDVLHRGYTSRGGGIREITVKSISWAMGVRRPGFLMLSLWNPIDEAGHTLHTQPEEQGFANEKAPNSTLQSRLCLLPDQLRIFIQYGLMLGFMISILVIRAFFRVYSHQSHWKDSERYIMNGKRLPFDVEQPMLDISSSISHTNQLSNGIASRSTASRSQSDSSADDYGTPNMERVNANNRVANSTTKDESQMANRRVHGGKSSFSTRKRLSAIFLEVAQGSLTVALVVVPWYIWLFWTG